MKLQGLFILDRQCFHYNNHDAKFIIMGGLEFPTWRMDRKKVNSLINVIEDMEIDTCVLGHWFPASREEILQELKTHA